jgi:hypothetical protein
MSRQSWYECHQTEKLILRCGADTSGIDVPERLKIDDMWVLAQAGYRSRGFATFLSGLARDLDLPPDARKELEKADQMLSPQGLEKMGVPGFVQPLVSSVLRSLDPVLSSKIREGVRRSQERLSPEKSEQLEEKFSKLDKKLEKLDNLGSVISDRVAGKLLRTGQASVAKALLDVARERGVTNKDLLRLIEMMPEFEALMYFLNVRKFYRDHTAHSLRVAVLGNFLIDAKSSAGSLEGIIKDALGLAGPEVRTAWWFAGLLHDIGIPLANLFTSLNWSLVNEMFRCYPTLGMEVTPMRICLASTKLENAAYLPILTEGMPPRWQELVRNGLGRPDAPPEQLVYKAASQSTQEYKPGKAEMDHGVVAALSLLSTLGTPEQLREGTPEDRPLIEAARAIALHNLAKDLRSIPFEKYPLVFLLVLADELQEWSRPVSFSTKESYFTTSLQKMTFLDEVFFEDSAKLWDIPYGNPEAKKIVQFDFRRLCHDKAEALATLDCSGQYPESDLKLQDIDAQKGKAIFDISIKTKT